MRQPQILAAGLVFAALSLLVLFLLGLLRKYNRTRQALANLNADLETQVLERTADLSLSNERLEQEIAERRQVEATMRQLSRAVEQSWSTIVITDLNGNIVFVNPAFERITGYSREEAIG